MERMSDIVVIGGTACGPKAAARARRCDSKARITLIEQDRNVSVATCGLPYYVSGVINSERTLLVRGPAYFKETMDVDVMVGTRATAIDRAAHTVDITDVSTGRASAISYDRLVLATGAVPVIPPIEGTGLAGVFTLTKMRDASGVRDWVSRTKASKAVIVGAGPIGLEMAEALVTLGLDVTVVEALNWVLPGLLDFEMAAHVQKRLAGKGAKLVLGRRLARLEGEGGKVARALTARSRLY